MIKRTQKNKNNFSIIIDIYENYKVLDKVIYIIIIKSEK